MLLEGGVTLTVDKRRCELGGIMLQVEGGDLLLLQTASGVLQEGGHGHAVTTRGK